MDQIAGPRRLHAHLLSRAQNPRHSFLLNDAEFRVAAQCERMRVDRNGSVLTLLLIELSQRAEDRPGIGSLVRQLEGRLRVTDTPGLLADGRVAVLLPDTPPAGAWKVAEDISECYPPGPGRPQCDVRVYPPRNRKDGFDQLADDAAAPRSVEGTEDPGRDDLILAQRLPIWKRAVDVVGGLLGLTLSAPIVALAGIGIKLTSSGPVFFKQEREGLAGRKFTIYKLRTMCVDAEERLDDLRDRNHQDGPAFKMTRDPRTTTIGRLLRKTSIDELPQFWNVLRGDMSLVGPRPLPTAESVACNGWQRRRLDVTPGLTCTWQVSGRGEVSIVSFDEWVRMDLHYVKRRSLWTDLKLVVWTVPAILFRLGNRDS